MLAQIRFHKLSPPFKLCLATVDDVFNEQNGKRLTWHQLRILHTFKTQN